MLQLNLCDSSQYYKDINRDQELGRIPLSTEDIEIIGAATGNRQVNLSYLNNSCALKNIASISILFWQSGGLFLVEDGYMGIPISGSGAPSWITHHGQYNTDTEYTIDNIFANSFIQLSGAILNSSYLSSRQIVLNNGGINNPYILCNTLSLNNTSSISDNSAVCLRNANIKCSKFIANINVARIDTSSIIADTQYQHISGDISILQSNIISPNVLIKDGYLLDSIVNFNTLHISGGNISSQCIYDESLGEDGKTTISSGNFDAGFSLECPNLIIDSSGWLEGTMNVKLVSGLIPNMRIGLSGKMIAESSIMNTIYNSGYLEINDAYSLQHINNYHKLTINNIGGVLSGSGNRIFLYNHMGAAECNFYAPYLNLRSLENFGKIQCQRLATNPLYPLDVNNGTIKADSMIIKKLINQSSGIINSMNDLILEDSYNQGTLFGKNIELINTYNYSIISGGPVIFYNSVNLDNNNIIDEAIFKYKEPYNNPPINSGLLNNGIFYSGSINFGSGNNLSFYDISQNRGIISGHNKITFYESSSNHGNINNNVNFYNKTLNSGTIYFGNFYDRSTNDALVYSSKFYDNTSNKKNALNCSFYNLSTNSNDAIGCSFFDFSINKNSLTSGSFYDESRNVSVKDVMGVIFWDNSVNDSGVVFDAAFNNNSLNLGTVISGWFNETVNSGLCAGKATQQIHNTVFVGAKAANLANCSDGNIYFSQGASNGAEIVVENFWSSGVNGLFADTNSVIESATGVYFWGSSKNLGMIYDSVSVEFDYYSTNFGMIDNCDQVKFTNATHGPSFLVRTDTRPYYTYAGIRNCKNIIFTQNSYNKAILQDNNIITFDENSQNQANIYRAYEVLFLNESINLAQNITTDKILFSNTVHSIGDIVAGISMDFDSAINRKSIAYESMAVNFVDNSFNYAPIRGRTVVFDMSHNSSSVFVRSNLTFSAGSSNWGTISGDLANMVFDASLNAGTILTQSSIKEIVYNNANPYTNTVTFTNGSINNGTISGAYVYFTNHSINSGIVLGEALFDNTSKNWGIVSGQIL